MYCIKTIYMEILIEQRGSMERDTGKVLFFVPENQLIKLVSIRMQMLDNTAWMMGGCVVSSFYVLCLSIMNYNIHTMI